MTRIKRGVIAHYKHKKIIKLAKGYYGSRSKIFRVAKQAVIKAHQYSYINRKQKKRNFRKIWIIRINAALKSYHLSYKNFIYLINKLNVKINRKLINYLSIFKPIIFNNLIINLKNNV